jgi:hypothetical protein
MEEYLKPRVQSPILKTMNTSPFIVLENPNIANFTNDRNGSTIIFILKNWGIRNSVILLLSTI